MLKIKYLGIYPFTVPESIGIEGTQTVSSIMKTLILSNSMPEDFFWDRHLVLLNGKQPEMDDFVSDGDSIQILSFSEGG